MSELKQLVVVSVEENEISVTLQVAELDYSAIYDAKMYKQSYNKETEAWETTEEATERFEQDLTFVGGSIPVEDQEIELFVDEESGRAFFKEGTGFIKIEKPDAKAKMFKKAEIVQIKDSAKGRAVVVKHKDVHYSFNFNTGVWVEKVNKFIPNPAKLAKAKARFNELFEDVNVTWDNAELAIGMVVDCKVNKNALQPNSPHGWLEPMPLDPDEQSTVLETNADDLPF